MARRKNIDQYQKGRAGREKRLRQEFCPAINSVYEKIASTLRFNLHGITSEPDYEVAIDSKTVAYFEAEFPDEGRWPFGDEFQFPTIRWPDRKWDHYKPGEGFFDSKPLFFISIRGDLGDAYYLDGKTWFAKGKKEKFWDSVFYGLPKSDPDLGRGLAEIESYVRNRVKTIYGITI